MKNSHDEQLLSQESLGGESFSSNVHNQELFVEEAKEVQGGIEYDIPERYHIDTLVFMPINLDTSFVYWEVTPNLLASHQIPIERMIAKVYEVENDSEAELCEFQVNAEVGKYYLHLKSSMKRVQAKMGYYNENGQFIVVLISNIFRLPNDRIEFSNDEIWMSLDETTREIIRASLSKSGDPISSRDLLKEKIIESTKLRGYSSSDLIKGEK